ncbi:MAG: HPr kinase/phosphatase C-terminal domain-containing protein [Hyphomicrobiales bacterium]
MPKTIHATLVQVYGQGVLLRGPSNSGKSSIALRLIDEAELARATGHLVADDQVIITSHDNHLVGEAPDNLFGQIEIRGVGIINIESRRNAAIDLVVDLVPHHDLERMPDENLNYETIAGIKVRRIHIAERNPDASVIIRTILKTLPQDEKNPMGFA